MPSGSDKWIRSVKDNPAGKVVADPAGNRWEWDSGQGDETSRLLKKLQNDELAIEQTDIVRRPLRRADAPTAEQRERPRTNDLQPSKPLKKKTGGRDAGGGFNPYDNTGKPRR